MLSFRDERGSSAQELTLSSGYFTKVLNEILQDWFTVGGPEVH